MAIFDTMIIVWKEKRRWDAVRPFSAIRYLYGDQVLTLLNTGIKIIRGGGAKMSFLDTMIIVWKLKRRCDAVRPFSAIQYLYGDQLHTLFNMGFKAEVGGRYD